MWKCQTCSFSNDTTLTNCDLCDANRTTTSTNTNTNTDTTNIDTTNKDEEEDKLSVNSSDDETDGKLRPENSSDFLLPPPPSTITVGTLTNVSPLGIGTLPLSVTYNLGSRPPTSEFRELVRYAVEKGVGWIDTADSYGRGEDQGELGYAENIIGEVIRDMSMRSTSNPSTFDSMSLRTRFGTKSGMSLISPDRWSPKKLLPSTVRSTIVQQRDRLGVNTIDLWSLHHVDSYTSEELEGILTVISSCQDEGLISNVGLCNATVEQVEKAMEIVRVAAVQNRYSVFDRTAEREGQESWGGGGVKRKEVGGEGKKWGGKRGMIHFCKENDITFFPYGCLGGVRRRNGKEDSDIISQFPEISTMAKGKGVSPEVMILAYYRQKFPQTLCLIVGCRSVGRVDELMKVGEVMFTEAEVEEIDRCGGGGGGGGGKNNGDWTCGVCGFLNFKSRSECFKSNCYGKKRFN
ncbi:hypothetical protein TrCOL_g136 [Triparma columacea]|uniref:RanBP2-type domain-containing protein n=1 Tax=Triparma columacea TaxID=722753 RepID=A0A9W7GFW3_9STRA|nr:hypothetical protein TrCOL_g136 [Triparma columacea]